MFDGHSTHQLNRLLSRWDGDQGTACAGGQRQPVTSATIQLYQYGLADNASAATPLLTQPVQTDSTGSFTIHGPLPMSPERAGVWTSTISRATRQSRPRRWHEQQRDRSDGGIALVRQSCRSSTQIQVDAERSTLTAVSEVAQYMSSYQNLGDNGALLYFNNAYDAVGAGFSYAIGMVPTISNVPFAFGVIPFGFGVPTTTINSFANMIGTCINSPGGVEGDGSPCGNLFTYAALPTNGPMNTIQAVLNIALNPTRNASQLFGLGTTSGPFLPTLATAPTSWALNFVPLPTNTNYGIAIVTAGTPGVVNVPFSTGGSGAFSVAINTTINTTSNPVTISTSTGGAALPLNLSICQTNSVGQCLAPPAQEVALSLTSGTTPTFSVFVTATAPVSNAPIYVSYSDANGTVLATASVNVITN